MAQYLDKEGLQTALSLVKEYISTKLANKQDTLTIGEGLTLEDNVLSLNLDTNIFEYVSSLPDTPEDTNKIYIVLATSDESETGNLYEEYYWNTNDGAWEKIGSFTTDFSQYWTYDEDASTLTNNVADTVIIANDLTVSGTERVTAISLKTDTSNANATLWPRNASSTSSTYIGETSGTGQSKLYVGTNRSTTSSITYVAMNAATSSDGSVELQLGRNSSTSYGTTKVVIASNDSNNEEASSSVIIGATANPCTSFTLNADSSAFNTTATFNSVAYGTTPDSYAESTEIVTASWVNDKISEIEENVVVNLDQTIENNIQSYLNWIEID